MERAGLVDRRPDPDDARVTRVRWTARGEQALRQAREMRLASLEARLRALPATELALLGRAVGIIERIVRDEGPPSRRTKRTSR
jgi:DNA-binding MarR family transcriptional regulator